MKLNQFFILLWPCLLQWAEVCHIKGQTESLWCEQALCRSVVCSFHSPRQRKTPATACAESLSKESWQTAVANKTKISLCTQKKSNKSSYFWVALTAAADRKKVTDELRNTPSRQSVAGGCEKQRKERRPTQKEACGEKRAARKKKWRSSRLRYLKGCFFLFTSGEILHVMGSLSEQDIDKENY
jgi:hypothetical protein